MRCISIPGHRGYAPLRSVRDSAITGSVLANLWFPPGARRRESAGCDCVDSSEEMRDREEENLQQLFAANSIGAAAVSHEVRNLCGAIAVVSANLTENTSLGPNDDIQALTSLVRGLRRFHR